MNVAQPPPQAAAPAVVLVHFGDPGTTLRCLRSLRERETAVHQVVVVDNGPGHGLRQALAAEGFSGRIIEAHHNPGFGAACNLGAEAALADGAGSLWFLNNDAVVEMPLLARLRAAAEAHPAIQLWGTHQLDRGTRIGPDVQPEWYARGLEPRALEPGLPGAAELDLSQSLSGASVFLRRETWQRLGPWPEWCFLYWEDAAWCRRARSLGMRLAILDEAVSHDRGTTTGRRSPLTVYYGARNQLLLHRELLPGRRSERWRLALYGLQKRLFRGRFRELLPALRGILDALAARPRMGRSPRY